MKKIILSLFVGLFCFVSFSNAGLIPDIENTISDSSFTCNNYYCRYNSPNFTSFNCVGNGNISVNYDYQNFKNNTYSMSCPGTFNTSVDKINYIQKNPGVNVSLVYTIVSSPSSQLSPVVSGLWSVFGEFIPYIVYVSIGILLVTLGFYCVKWLMVWMGNKIKKYF